MDPVPPPPPPIERRLTERRRLVLHVDAAGDSGTGAGSDVAPRRSGTERRQRGERRRRVVSVPRERRRAERRGPDRRSGRERRAGDRRVEGPRAFTAEEAASIVRAAGEGGPVPCPRCGLRVVLRPPVSSTHTSVWTVACRQCRCQLRIANL